MQRASRKGMPSMALAMGAGLLVGVRAWMEEGFTDGIDGSRYAMWQETPKPEELLESKRAGEDVKCGVCEVILGNLLEGVGMLSNEDQILSVLESEPSDEEIEAAVAKRDKNLVNLAKGRKGCNRHFKDSYLRKGWDVEGCIIPEPNAENPDEKRPPWQTVYGTCVKSGVKVQNETKMDTYSTRMEAIYWGCQLTIGDNVDKVASFITKKIKAGTEELPDIIKQACEKPAKCKKLKYQLSYEKRIQEADDKWKKQQSDALSKTLKNIGVDENGEKKRRRRRAAKSEDL
eukprot:CAMPEP_0176236172 /NCGR_PEP_ID=MMETSP0121_2-20121125/27209_1 /TAXON_ID=160619 /ORGANISM="Kryptoperidinium foliaceum, Strain CCMP 1326" /LENGTH=287 /DNA_ID=CAMNT_0017575601 /DNA_START=66 /DNA_END=929 /DNA_ORIENTATION=-